MADEKHPIIDYHDLDLTLALRPINNPNILPQTITNTHVLPSSNGNITSKREQQAIRRHQAKVKRDFKRKAASFCTNSAGFRPFNKGHNGNFIGMNNENADTSSVSSATSSAVSDNYYTNSAAGGHSSDTSSQSSHPHIHLPTANAPTSSSTLQQPTSSQQEETANCSNHNIHQPQLCSSSSNQRNLFTNSRPLSKSPDFLASANINTIPQPSEIHSKEAKQVVGTPPKPNGQITSQESGQISQMPCVTTTGNGPKGKTITGFLYKYTKTEVTIVCVCHGASFSPAAFVEHAGGVDIEHPLKHIRVAPFPLS